MSFSETFKFFFQIILALTFIHSFVYCKKTRNYRRRQNSENKTSARKKSKFPECSFKEKSKPVIFTL